MDNPKGKLSFCESVHAGSASQWHLRVLTDKGKKLGGGVDTPSLCGHVQPPRGWDLAVDITEHRIEKNTCKRCLGVFVNGQVELVTQAMREAAKRTIGVPEKK